MTGGTYSLVVAVSEATTAEVGALGERVFEPGAYAYAGSARGPGGFARLERHRAVAAGERETRHWHLDYLLGQEAASVVGAFRTPDVDAECAVAAGTPGAPVPGFGASDCDCVTHLHGPRKQADLRSALGRVHERLGAEGRVPDHMGPSR